MNKEQEIFVGNLLKELGPDQLQDDSENLFLRDSNEQEITMVEEGVELPVAVCVDFSEADLKAVEGVISYYSANDVHQLIRMLYKKDKEVERLRSTLMEIATKYNIPVDDIDEL